MKVWYNNLGKYFDFGEKFIYNVGDRVAIIDPIKLKIEYGNPTVVKYDTSSVNNFDILIHPAKVLKVFDRYHSDDKIRDLYPELFI